MMSSSNTHHFDDGDDAIGEVGVKSEGKGRDNKVSSHRSKHSETEQQRRSKINERFQILRDIIPQNDQKRDKASFLLEVIEYIQFLQEKLHVYEGSFQGWSLEPTKLTPWRNYSRPAKHVLEQSQFVKKDSNQENSVMASPIMLTNTQSSADSDLGSAAVVKSTDRLLSSATQAVPLNMQVQPNLLDHVDGNCLASQPLDEPAVESENISSKTQSRSWQSRICTDVGVIPNHIENEHEMRIENRSESLSRPYSQGILTTLTQALQSSGVDLSQASISVNVDVGKRAIDGLTTMASSSKDHNNQSLNNQAIAQSGVDGFDEESQQTYKRLRRD